MSSSKSPAQLDEQPSELLLDFNLAVLNAQTQIFVQQHSSEIKTLVRRATSSVFDIWQKLLKVTAIQMRKNYVLGCSPASGFHLSLIFSQSENLDG